MTVNKERQIFVRVGDAQYKQLIKLADASGNTVAGIVRQMVYEKLATTPKKG